MLLEGIGYKYDERFNGIVFVSSLAFLGIFFALTFLTKLLKRLVLDKAEGSFTRKLKSSWLAAMSLRSLEANI